MRIPKGDKRVAHLPETHVQVIKHVGSDNKSSFEVGKPRKPECTEPDQGPLRDGCEVPKSKGSNRKRQGGF